MIVFFHSMPNTLRWYFIGRERSLSAEDAITFHSGRYSTGRLLVSPPSTRSRPPIVRELNTPGIDIDARTAVDILPVDNLIHSPVSISVAIIVRGMYVSEKLFHSNSVSRYFSIFFHLMSPRLRSISTSDIQDTVAMIFSISCEVFPRASSAPMIAHILVPAMAIGDTQSSSRRLMIPIWASPRAAPPPSARENDGVLFDDIGIVVFGYIRWMSNNCKVTR